MRGRAFAAVVAVALCIMGVIPTFSPPSLAEGSFVVETFGNGQRSVTVGFPTAGMDDSASLSLQTGLSIDNASLTISSVRAPQGSTDYPTNVSVDFGGDGVPEWQFVGQNIGSLGRQSVFSNGMSKVDMDFKTTNYNNTLAIRLPKRATVTNTGMTLGFGSSGKYLIIYSCAGYLNLIDDIQTYLKQYPDVKAVDSFDASAATPTLGYLQGYNSVLLFNLAYNSLRWGDSAGLGNVLADYVDGGGGVVLCLYLWMSGWTGNVGGRFDTNYYCWNPTISGMSCGSTLAWGSATLPEHPIMKGVTNINIPGQMWTGSVALCGDAQTVFMWGNSVQGCAVRTINGVNRVDIQMTPYTAAAAAPTYSYGWAGDGGLLIKNSLVWTSGKASSSGGGPGAWVDIFNDGSRDFDQPIVSTNFSFPNMASAFNNYIARAPVAYTDPYGTEFVDVPINVTPYNRTSAVFGNLDITYDLTSKVSTNPVTGDLSSALTELTSPKPGNYNSTIPILVASITPGRLTMHDLRLSMHAPYHRPSITSFFPAATAVVKEGTTLELGINATDWYGASLTYKWYYDGKVAEGVTQDRMTVEYGFKDAGSYTARVEVTNPFETVQQTWKITVQNVNRPPEISGFAPDGKLMMPEGTSLAFSINATDPDGETVGYLWTVDGIVQGSSSSWAFTYRTDYSSAGDHIVRVAAADPGSLTAVQEWIVHVNDVDRPPLLTAWEPKDDPTLIENQQQLFSVSATDEDGQGLKVAWTLDGTTVSEEGTYLFQTDYSSEGVRTLQVTVTDGELQASREWKITVLDLNRPPTAAIDSPRDNTEFMQGVPIHFSANSSSDPDGEGLSHSWKEGGVMVSDQVAFDRAFTHGLHTLVLEVRDHAGAVSQATVHFRVRWVELSLVMGLDRLDASAGDNVLITVTMGNVGDTRAADQKLDILVDGKRIATEDLPTLDSSGSYRTQFQWKATKGAHTITAVVGDQSWNEPVSVAVGKPAAAGASAMDFLWLVTIAALAVGLALWGRSAVGKKHG